MKQYRIKKEAVPFILEKYITKIMPLEHWENIGICDNALEEIKPPFITHGIKTSDISSDLGGWDAHGSRFCFTLHFPGVKFIEHDKFTKGAMTRKLMDQIQQKVNYFFSDFLEEPTP